jgi:hypothetical protein
LELITHDWFTRAWVLQEVSYATYVHFQYGEHEVRWDILEACGEIRRNDTGLSNKTKLIIQNFPDTSTFRSLFDTVLTFYQFMDSE